MSVGNVAIAMKNLDGSLVHDATGSRQKLLVGAYRQQDQATMLDDWLNAIVFLGGMLHREQRIPDDVAPEWKLAAQDMQMKTGVEFSDFVILNLDLFSRRLTWDQKLAGYHGWPEKGTRVHPSPGFWMRGSEYSRAPYIGALSTGLLPPMQSPGIDGIPGLTTMATCATTRFFGRAEGLRGLQPRAVEMGMEYVNSFVLSEETPRDLMRLFGERFVAKDPKMWDNPERDERGVPLWWKDRASWSTSWDLPPGLYSAWRAWVDDPAAGRQVAIFLFGGLVRTLHPHFGWVVNTEHWDPGTGTENMCIAVTNVDIKRDAGWAPIPGVHFHSIVGQPNHRVYAYGGALVVSKSKLAMPEVKVGTIFDLANT